jgi:hypothetical protein
VIVRRTLAALVGLTALALGAVSLAPSAAAAPASKTGVVNCTGTIEHRPSEIVIACADAGVMITGITWKSWTNARARGTGTLVWNTCLPETCVAGIVEKYKVAITLGRVASAPNPPVFTRVTVGFPAGGPAMLETGSYTLDRPISAQG